MERYKVCRADLDKKRKEKSKNESESKMYFNYINTCSEWQIPKEKYKNFGSLLKVWNYTNEEYFSIKNL